MIGALSVPQFVTLAVFSFGFLGLVIFVIADARDTQERYTEGERSGANDGGVVAPTMALPAHRDEQAFMLDVPVTFDTLDDRDEFLACRGIGKRHES